MKFPEPLDDSYCTSTRIRIARNLKNYPLGTFVTREQRKNIESVAIEAFDSLKGSDLEGTYYPLSQLSEKDRNQLIADHFLFKEGDRFLAACGLNRDWPESRGIFHNKSKTFLTWVNEEDQFRIISMQSGGDIREVFNRLKRGAESISNIAEFAINPHLGAITTCPTNCGTGLRASIHVKLPLLSK